MSYCCCQSGCSSSMFCYQCEQVARPKGQVVAGCTVQGVCGKTPEVALLQDLMVHAAKAIGQYRHALSSYQNAEMDVFVLELLFSTVTNVNFDTAALVAKLQTAATMLETLRSAYANAFLGQTLSGPASFAFGKTAGELLTQARSLLPISKEKHASDDRTATHDLVLYGLKGTAAYADHAHILGYDDPTIFSEIHACLAALSDETLSVEGLLVWALKVGELNLKVMGLLDKANTDTYGTPAPTAVRITPVKGKAILVSGHDLKDLKALLEQTEGKGINIYTHGEMLPAHAYPELHKHAHLVGNYGGAWQNQAAEFDAFPGAILMTTNCIQAPKDSYQKRIFTTGLVGWPGVTHVAAGEFGAVIDAALSSEGFAADAPAQQITVGFGHGAVLGLADTVINAVKSGAVKHFFLIGGCDGAKPGRNYFTDFADLTPKDSVILTLGCGKYRFNKNDYGSIGPIPRLLDMGQCNDAYSAIQVAIALSQAFNCSVNELPLSLIISWYEQKAVAVLLTLLHLGVRNIRLGPTLPAFVSENVLKILVEKFAIAPTTTAEADLAAILGAE